MKPQNTRLKRAENFGHLGSPLVLREQGSEAQGEEAERK